MEMVGVKTEELVGAALDWSVAKVVDLPVEIGLECCGFGIQTSIGSPPECCGDPVVGVYWKTGKRYQPSSDEASISACRLLVELKLGETVLVPKELVK